MISKGKEHLKRYGRKYYKCKKDSLGKRGYIDDFDYINFLNKSQKPLISVIVPFYRTASYLETCIQSVLAQTYSCFELILVDDGSDDGSRDIALKLNVEHERIRLQTQEHLGVSAARNTGIRAAHGKYLFFLDSDDAIHPELLMYLCILAEKSGAGVCTCPLHSVPSENFEKERRRLDRKRHRGGIRWYSFLNKQEALRSLSFENEFVVLSAAGGTLIRKCKAAGVWFDEESSNGEDTKYMYQLLEKGTNAVILRYSGYYYRKRNSSASRVQSLRAYKSLYDCYCYIRDREIEHGRKIYAVQWEQAIIGKISGWHALGHVCKNPALIKYTRELGKIERLSSLWEQLGYRSKLEYGLAFYCYPTYEVCHILRQIWRAKKRKS